MDLRTYPFEQTVESIAPVCTFFLYYHVEKETEVHIWKTKKDDSFWKGLKYLHITLPNNINCTSQFPAANVK